MHPSSIAKFALVVTLTTTYAAMAQTAAPAPTPQTANTPYAIGAQRSGVVKCIGRINQITSFVTGSNSNSGMVLNSPSTDANQRIVSSIIEVEGGGSTSFVSASFAPGAGPADCSATYDAVTYWNASCSQVATSNFGAFKATRPLLKSINTLDGGLFAKVFLMPAGNGCISIKKEMLF
jgi:hypothetical protein